MITDRSPYWHLRNTTQLWLPMDTEPLYHSNLRSRPQEMEPWRDQIIHYTFNSDGFRCPEFDYNSDRNCVFLGCSNTVGVGLTSDQMWAVQVAQQLNLRACILAAGGAGWDTLFRLAVTWLDRLKPKQVIVRPPPEGVRLELIKGGRPQLITTADTHLFQGNPILKEWIADDNNQMLNALKNRLALTQLCGERGIALAVLDANPISKVDLARDLMHSGPKTNALYAEYALAQIPRPRC